MEYNTSLLPSSASVKEAINSTEPLMLTFGRNKVFMSW